MCGIFGFIGNIDAHKAQYCIDLLAHRGPDGSGLVQLRGATLAHRRLAILDLSERAGQPMSFGHDRYWITYNGEIYNFLELRQQLEGRGYEFKTDSDTEVVLASFVEWREDCLYRFNGMWAFAIWDCREQTLFLSRDRFGKKPLFYLELPGRGFAFASEMKALFPLMDQVVANMALVGQVRLVFQYESTEQCVIKGIKRLRPGHFAWLQNGRLKSSRYWCTLDHLVKVPTSYDEQVDQLRELFLDACRLRMRSDVSIGTALSGGLDSSSTISAVAHLAKEKTEHRMSTDWQHAYIASFPDSPLDEARYAKMVTDHLQIPATFLKINPIDALDRLDDFFYLFEEIYITLPIPFMLLYSAMREDGTKVTLDGHGADECFAGYDFDYLYALLDAGLKPRAVASVLDTKYASAPKDFQGPTMPPKPIFWLKWRLNEALEGWLGKETRPRDSSHPAWENLDHLTRRLYVSTHETILPTLLRNYDRYAMANSVEIRMPFMDYRIIQFAFSLPWTSKIRKGLSKAIVRDAMACFMPRQVAFRRDKIGFNSPVVDWMKGPLKGFFLDIISSSSFKECQLIDANKVEQKILHVIRAENPSFKEAEEAWTMLTPYLWERAVLKKARRIAHGKGQ